MVSLRLEEAIAIALERNLSLVVERYRRSESVLRLDGAWASTTSTPGPTLSVFDETNPAASNLDGADIRATEGTNWNFSVSKLVPSGGTASVNWNNSRFKTNSTFALLNPSFNVDLDFRFVQPLLRNAGREVVESGIRVARNNVEISRENFELQVIGVLQLVDDAYWSLVEAQAQLEVAEESLDLAEKLHEQNRVRVEVGTLAPLELITSEAGIATRKEEIIRARAAVGDAEDLLRQLLNLNETEIWAAAIAPETDPEMTPIALDVESGRWRPPSSGGPSCAAAGWGRTTWRSTPCTAPTRRGPRLNLAVTYGFNGLGGDVTSRDFFTGEILFQAPGDYGDALDQITGGDFDGWSAALNFSYDIGNRDSQGAARPGRGGGGARRGGARRSSSWGSSPRCAGWPGSSRPSAEARESARVSRRLAGEEPRRRAEALPERHVDQLPGPRDPGGPEPGAQPRGEHHHRLSQGAGALPPGDRHADRRERRRARRSRGLNRPAGKAARLAPIEALLYE